MSKPHDMIVGLLGALLGVWLVVRLIRAEVDAGIMVAVLVFISIIVFVLQRCASARSLGTRLLGEAGVLLFALFGAGFISLLINPGATLQETFASADFWLLPAIVLVTAPLLELNEL